MSDVVVHIEEATDGTINAPPADTRDLVLPDSQNDWESASPTADGHVQIDPSQEPPGDSFKQTDLFQRTDRGLLKPLIAVATAQYFIVAALAGLAAWAIASEATEAINAKLEPVLAALKRF